MSAAAPPLHAAPVLHCLRIPRPTPSPSFLPRLSQAVARFVSEEDRAAGLLVPPVSAMRDVAGELFRAS